MTMHGLMRKLAGAAAAAGVLAAMQAPAAGQVVGKAAAVNQDSTLAGRVLEIGAAVVHKQRIVTNARGSTQLMFIDQTTLNIGPNSDLVIDEYVFDPERGVGKMSVSLGKGLMRFVGGQITHNGSATVKTPPATIGIRGGVVDISTNGATTTASNSYGTVTITPSAGGAAAPVPQGSTGSTSGGAPTVGVTTQQQASSNNQQFRSSGTQTGGVSEGTSSSAASYSNSSTSTTSTITTTSGPAAGSTAPGPSTTTASGGGTGPGTGGASFGNPNSPTTVFPNLSGQPAGTTSGAPSTPGGNAPAAPQQTPPSGGGGGCVKCP